MIIETGVEEASQEATARSKITPFKKSKKFSALSQPLPVLGSQNLQKVAASADIANDNRSAIQVRDDVLEGFIQIIEYKENQYLISGHLTLFVAGKSLRLILPNGKTIENFKEEDGLLTFRRIVSEKFELATICYELY